jgi:hypothetical protein
MAREQEASDANAKPRPWLGKKRLLSRSNVGMRRYRKIGVEQSWPEISKNWRGAKLVRDPGHDRGYEELVVE